MLTEGAVNQMVKKILNPKLHLYSAIAFLMAGIGFMHPFANDSASSDRLEHVLVGAGFFVTALLQVLAWSKKSRTWRVS